jgi:putative inorganic carbon (HCO3(-)) transporter
MTARLTWRPPWYVWVLAGVAGLAVLHYKSASLTHGYLLVVAAGLIAAGMLALRRLWEMPPAALMCVAIALAIFSGSWSRVGLGGFPLDRSAMFLVVLMFLLRAPGLARIPRIRIRGVHLLLALTLMYVFASALVSGTLTTEAGGLGLLDQVGATPYLMFLLVPAAFALRRERTMLLATLVAVGAYLGLMAVFESIGPHSLVFPHYIVHADIEAPEGRAGGPFQSSVAEGFATYACGVAAVIAFAQWRNSRWRWVAGLVAIVSAFACFVTLERGVWIAAIAGTVVAALTARAGRRLLLPGAALCVLVIGGALLLSPSLSSRTSTRVNNKPSVWSRENQTEAGLRMIAAKPVFGFGWRRFTQDELEYFRQPSDIPMLGYATPDDVEPLHDSYLSYAVELGLAGTALWLASLLYGTGSAIFGRGPAELVAWKRGLLAVTVFFLVVSLFNPYMVLFPVLLLWTWAGVAAGAAGDTPLHDAVAARMRPRLRPISP